MKKFSLIIALAAFAAISTISAQNLRREENWLQAWKNLAGSNYSAAWLMEEVAEGATVFVDASANTLIVKIDADLDSMDEIKEVLEAGIQSSNGNRMLATGQAEALDFNTAVNTWNGQLGGKSMYASVVAQLQQSGNSQMFVQLSLQPLHQDKVARNEAVTAMLHQMETVAADSPVVLGSR